MRVTHRCQFCDSDYPCDTMQEVSEDVYRCSCKSVDSCPGCSEHGACEDCGAKSATGDGHKPFHCAECAEGYEPPEREYDDGVSIAELSERAYRERAELRRRD